MRKITLTTFIIGLIAVLAGCESYRQSVRNIGSSMGVIDVRDIAEADGWRGRLPAHLGLSSMQVTVEPASSTTQVVIKGVVDEGEKARISKSLEVLNEKNPQLNPLKWKFE